MGKKTWPSFKKKSSPHLPVPYIFGTRGLYSYLICWQLGATGSKYIADWKMRVYKKKQLPSLKLTAMLHLKMNGWIYTPFLLGPNSAYFHGRNFAVRCLAVGFFRYANRYKRKRPSNQRSQKFLAMLRSWGRDFWGSLRCPVGWKLGSMVPRCSMGMVYLPTFG